MNFRSLSRLALPPAPESPSLRLHRVASAGLLFLSAVLVAYVSPIVAFWRPLILLYPLVLGGAFVLSLWFFQRRSRWNEAYWTEERRVLHYLRVREEEARKREGVLPADARERLR
jgi:hypothetical protein